MDYSEACKGSCECEKCETGKIAEANMEFYGSEEEEGEIREVHEPPRLESPIQKVTPAIVEQEQVHIRQSASPPRASHKGESTGTVVLQQQSMYGAIHKDMSASIVHSFVQDAIEKEQVNMRPSTSPERGSYQGRIPCIVFVQQSKYSAIPEDMAATPSASSQGVVEDEPSTLAQRVSHIGVTASTAVVQQSKYTASEGQHVDTRQHRLRGSHRPSFSPSACSSAEERHKKRQEGCFRYSDFRWVLKMIEEVCSERLRTLLSRQNRDRKNLKIAQKKYELEFFQKHMHSYKVRLAHVMPTISYCRMMLPKLHFSILRNRFHKHMKSQLIKFVKQQIRDRNKENRIKARWIFEAKAGYLKKLFYVTSLAYGKFKLEKLKCRMTDYLDGEEHLKYFNMQSLTTQIEAIASNKESECIFTSDVTEPILENSPVLLETNGPTKLGFSIGVAEDMTTLESRSSLSTCAPTMEFGEKNGTQTAFSAAAQNQGGNLERPYACQLGMSAVLEPAKAVTTGKPSDVSEPIEEHSPLLLVTNGATQLEFSVDVSEEMVTLESSSSQLTGAPGMEFGENDGTQIAFSAAAQTVGENMESPCASRFVTSSTSELTVTVSNDTENAAQISREKRRRISSGNDVSEGTCCMSRRKFGEKDGIHSALSPAAQNEGRDMERSCASDSDKDATLESAMTENTDSENTLDGSNEKQTRISSGNSVSEVPSSRSQIKSKPTSNPCRTTLHQEEPRAAWPSPPLVNNSQIFQAEDTRGEEVPSGHLFTSAQVTDEPNMRSNAQSVMNQRHCGSTSQAASRPYQPTGGNTHSARTEAGSLGASHVLASDAQLPTGSTSGQFLAEDGSESNPFTIELSRLRKLHELIAKRHQEKREQLILARQVEIAQAKKKYEELVYNSDVEVLQRRRELKITSEKIYKQQILAEVLQVIFKASAKVVPDSSRGAAQKTTREPNRSSDQRSFQFTAPVSAPASASIYQSPQLSVQASTDATLRQHGVTGQHTYMDPSGRSTANLMNYPSGGMGLAYRR